jgi:hypothetical protein
MNGKVNKIVGTQRKQMKPTHFEVSHYSQVTDGPEYFD